MTTGFNYRILVVDDGPAILKTSTAILQKKGYEVRTAEDGFTASAELRRSLPDVIISCLGMPNMSGFELLSIVRGRFPQIPVIAISGEYNFVAPPGLLSDDFFKKGDYWLESVVFGRSAQPEEAHAKRRMMDRLVDSYYPRSGNMDVLSQSPHFLIS